MMHYKTSQVNLHKNAKRFTAKTTNKTQLKLKIFFIIK